ncbi:MAG TPA: hypothetical protein VHT96_14880 [Clostridia bacterium]|nr:hypothetical protein [Clostridia bacterium]
MGNQFDYQNYLIRRKILTLAGAKFHVFNPEGQVILFSKMKAFKLKEDIRIYTSEDMQEELLTIHARNIIDISATYDVFDAKENQLIGSLKRKGMKSIMKDEWSILDKNGFEIGLIKEDRLLLALVRRILTNLVPQKYHVEMNGIIVSTFKQNFNPFVIKLNLDFTENKNNALDKRLGLAAGILLCAIEGKQN